MEAAAFTLTCLFLLLATVMAICGMLGVLNGVRFCKCHECQRWMWHPVTGTSATCLRCYSHQHLSTEALHLPHRHRTA